MKTIKNAGSPAGMIILILVMISALAMEMGYTKSNAWYKVLFITLPLLLLVAFGAAKKNHT